MRMKAQESVTNRVTCFLTWLLCRICSGLELTAPPSQTASFQSDVVLSCTFHVNHPPINPQFLAIIWSFGKKEFLKFDTKEKVVSDGVSFDEQAARQGDASLTIHNVSIANNGVYTCLVIYTPDRLSRDIQLNVQAPPIVKISKKTLHKDKRNKVACSMTGFFPREIRVTWLRNNIEVLHGSEMGEFQRNADGTFRVNNSIVLTSAQIQDHPSITCQVEHVSLQKPIQDGFVVIYEVAPKVQLTSSKTPDGNEYLYVCEARGYFPEPLSINWLLDGKNPDLSRRSEEGVFNKEIYYRINLQEDKIPALISCNVQHQTFNSPVTKSLEVQSYNECKRNCHMGLMVVLCILLLLPLVAISLLLWKVKDLKQFVVSHIHKEHVLGIEDKVNLYCMASKCPDVVQVTWTVTEEGQEPIIIPEEETCKDEEAGLLMNHEYTVKTDQTKVNGLQNAITVLSFNPTTSNHKNTTVKCKFQCGARREESTLDFSFTCKKPSVKGPIELSLDNSGDVVCFLVLKNFSPPKLEIQWTCGMGSNQKLPSTEVIQHDGDDTFQCTSSCRIPGQHFLDPGFKVGVDWKHESLYQPEHQEVSSKDFPWHPVVGNIKVPRLLHGREAKLQCEIRNYFPNRLEVKWLRREAGRPELYEVANGEKYKTPVLEVKQEPDQTYTCTASIVVAVSLKAEHKSELICRVTHPSLEAFIEKSTGVLTVRGIPIVTGKLNGKDLVVQISNFYPKEIKVTWSRFKEGKFVLCEENEYKVSEASPGIDGSFTCTSSVTSNAIQKYRQYKITVEHESLTSPIEKIWDKIRGTLEEVNPSTKDPFDDVKDRPQASDCNTCNVI